MKRKLKPNFTDQFETDLHDVLYDHIQDMIESAVEDNLVPKLQSIVPEYDGMFAPEEYQPNARYEVELREAKDKYIEALIKSLYGKLYQ